jgi:anti-sigma regulatory factor (Ser/Thr protein kinase)
MAGSYNHIVTDFGRLRNNVSFVDMIENLGDAYEMAEELYGMIWFLAAGDSARVEDARQRFKQGLKMSPGVQPMSAADRETVEKWSRPPRW